MDEYDAWFDLKDQPITRLDWALDQCIEALEQCIEPPMPFPDPYAHSWEAYANAVMAAYYRCRMPALAVVGVLRLTGFMQSPALAPIGTISLLRKPSSAHLSRPISKPLG